MLSLFDLQVLVCTLKQKKGNKMGLSKQHAHIDISTF